MTKEQFLEMVTDNYNQYFIIAIIVLIIIYLFLKKILKSLFHPFYLYYCLIFGFSIIGVIFLYFQGKISDFYFYFYLASQILFIIGLYIGKYFIHKNKKNKKEIKDESENTNFVYYFSFLIYFISNIFTYTYFGIPALEASRWETYNDVAGAGIIGRLIDVSKIFVIFFLVTKFLIIGSKKRIIDYFILLFLITTGFLTGSKMAIIDFIFIGFFSYASLSYSNYSVKKIEIDIKKSIFILSIILFSSLFTIYINQIMVNEISVNPILILFQRFILSPELQFMTYPNNILDEIYVEHSILEIIFLDLKTTFNRIGFSFNNDSLGLTVFYYHYPYLKDVVNMGTTSYFETFFLYHFGPYLAFFLCFLTGIFVGNKMLNFEVYGTLRKNLFQAAIAYLSIVIIFNPQIFITKIIAFIIFYNILYFIKDIIFIKITKKGLE